MRSAGLSTWVWIVGGIAIAIALGAGGTVAVNYISAAWMSSENAKKWATALSNAESDFDIPTGLLARIAYQESHFRQGIIDGTQASPAGALGMMQLMPQYFASVQRTVPFTDNDTQDQITEAAGFLSQLYDHYQNWTDVVAAYNAGQGTVDGVIAGKRLLPAETATYIANIAADLPGVVNPTLVA